MRKTLLAVIALSIPTVVVADEIADALTARQDNMKGRGEAVNELAKMAKGEIGYDPALAQQSADRLVELISVNMSGMWPEGSSSEDLPGKSRALPALWADGAKVGEIAGKLGPAAALLKEEAGKGQAEMTAALAPVGQVCTECHKAFQAPMK